MRNLVTTAIEIQNFLEEKHWKYCIIGGFALLNWGESRLTRDIDITLLTGFGNEENFIKDLLQAYPSRIPDALEFGLRNRVLLLKSKSGIDFDIALGGLPFEEDCVTRSVLVDYGNDEWIRICSADDLIIMKAFANRPIDWADIEGIIIRQQAKLDWNRIFENLSSLCKLKGEPEIVSKLLKLRDKIE